MTQRPNAERTCRFHRLAWIAALGPALGCEAPAAPELPASPSTVASPTSSLFPSRDERAARVQRDLARELETTLAAAPGVHLARVHLSLPSPPPLLGEAAANPPRAFVLLQLEGAVVPWSNNDVEKLLSNAIQGLKAADITLVTQQVAPHAAAPVLEPQWVQVGPLQVEQRSAGLLKALLGSLSAAGLLLVAVVVALWIRLRPLLQQAHQKGPPG